MLSILTYNSRMGGRTKLICGVRITHCSRNLSNYVCIPCMYSKYNLWMKSWHRRKGGISCLPTWLYTFLLCGGRPLAARRLVINGDCSPSLVITSSTVAGCRDTYDAQWTAPEVWASIRRVNDGDAMAWRWEETSAAQRTENDATRS